MKWTVFTPGLTYVSFLVGDFSAAAAAEAEAEVVATAPLESPLAASEEDIPEERGRDG